ncbi:MAG: sulfite oxidase heme-binding subunit YedZ [Gemmatimonadaceae bacterium]
MKVPVFALALVPALYAAWGLYSDFALGTRFFGSNPINEAEHYTGRWALRFLIATLVVSPLRRLTGWNWLIKYRRMLGLFTFAYATIHLMVFFAIDIFFDLGLLIEEIIERPYITIGMTTWLLLLPLALTSTSGWVKRLGGKRWIALHRLIYVAAVTGTVHFLWAVKKDIQRPLIYAAIIALLLGFRLWLRLRDSAAPDSRLPTPDSRAPLVDCNT